MTVETADICIVGTGYGGAITAARLSEYCARTGRASRIVVLEKGHDFFDFDPRTKWTYRNAHGNGFKQTLTAEYQTHLSDLHTDLKRSADGLPSFSVVGGKGIGGGSLINYAVALRTPSDVFELQEDGRRLWPMPYSRQHLNPYFDTAERVLRVSRMAWSTAGGVPAWQLCTKRDYVFAIGCLKIGATAEPLKIYLQDDPNDGWWLTGHMFNGRQHLPLNYLPLARQNGVVFNSECEVQWVAPNGPKRHLVQYKDKRDNKVRQLECKLLVLAAGAIGSTGILLKSRARFTGRAALSDHLGLHVSANGDFGPTGIVGRQYRVEEYKGKPMSSFCPSFWRDHRFLMEPYANPASLMAFGEPASFAYPDNPEAIGMKSARPATPLWGTEYKKLLKEFGDRILHIGIVGLDHCEGVVKTIKTPLGEFVSVDWPQTHPETERMWDTALGVARSLIRELDGELLLDSHRYRGNVGTVHPLGGCRMAPSKSDGVVDPYGEVFGNRNLFVIDGAIIPSALGVNPSLTISAMAEHICDHLASSLPGRLA